MAAANGELAPWPRWLTAHARCDGESETIISSSDTEYGRDDSPASAKQPVERGRQLRSLVSLHARHHHRHLVARSRRGDGEHDFVAEQRAHRPHAIDDPSQLESRVRAPPRAKRGVLECLLLGRGQALADLAAGIRHARRRRTPRPEDTRAGPKWCARDSRKARSGVRSWRTTPGAAGTVPRQGSRQWPAQPTSSARDWKRPAGRG